MAQRTEQKRINQSRHVQILGVSPGETPTKEELSENLFADYESRKPITFRIKAGGGVKTTGIQIKVNLTSLKRTASSATWWFEGTQIVDIKGTISFHEVFGHYDTRDKNGRMAFVDQSGLLSPCHALPLIYSELDGVSVGSCPECLTKITRKDRHGNDWWLGGKSHTTFGGGLTPVET